MVSDGTKKDDAKKDDDMVVEDPDEEDMMDIGQKKEDIAKPAEKTVETKVTMGALSFVFTLAHPEKWEAGDLFKALKQHDVRALVDTRPETIKGLVPAPEALKVLCKTSGIAFDRNEVLSTSYLNLVAQAKGEAEEGSRPCVLISEEQEWRCKQTRRCISHFMRTKGLEALHLKWNGEIDHEVTQNLKKEVVRRHIPRPPPNPRKFPMLGSDVKPPGLGIATGAVGPVLQSKPKASSSATSSDGPTMLPSKPKAGSSSVAANTFMTSTPKASNPKASSDAAIKKEPKGTGPVLLSSAPKASSSDKILRSSAKAPPASPPPASPSQDVKFEDLKDEMKQEDVKIEKVEEESDAKRRKLDVADAPVLRSSAKASSAPKPAGPTTPKPNLATATGAPTMLAPSAKGAPASMAPRAKGAAAGRRW